MMRQPKLQDELVEAPDGGYYQGIITLLDTGMEGTITLPGMGKVTVYKEFYQFPEPHISFAWKIRREP